MYSLAKLCSEHHKQIQTIYIIFQSMIVMRKFNNPSAHRRMLKKTSSARIDRHLCNAGSSVPYQGLPQGFLRRRGRRPLQAGRCSIAKIAARAAGTTGLSSPRDSRKVVGIADAKGAVAAAGDQVGPQWGTVSEFVRDDAGLRGRFHTALQQVRVLLAGSGFLLLHRPAIWLPG
jgi:hypothetical protein